jgi:hypothetical protein
LNTLYQLRPDKPPRQTKNNPYKAGNLVLTNVPLRYYTHFLRVRFFCYLYVCNARLLLPFLAFCYNYVWRITYTSLVKVFLYFGREEYIKLTPISFLKNTRKIILGTRIFSHHNAAGCLSEFVCRIAKPYEFYSSNSDLAIMRYSVTTPDQRWSWFNGSKRDIVDFTDDICHLKNIPRWNDLRGTSTL